MAYVVSARPPGGGRTWTVVDGSYRTVAPVEEWLEAHRQLWSPNTVRGYATGLAQWWTFLEQRDETAGWDAVGVPAVSGFLSWLRNGRTVEHVIARDAEIAPSPETLEARLAALISFYRWHGSVNDVPVAGKLLRGRPRRAPARGLLSHLDSRSEAQPSSLVRVRTIKRSDRPPLLLPHQVQAILDGCAVYDPQTGEWQGNVRDRFVFALLAETGMRLGEALGMRINEFVMGRGGTPYVQVVPREDNLNGARVKMLRPRRVYVGADLERLYADYLTHLACRAAEFGIPISPDELLFRNLDRPPLLSPLREGTVRDKVSALKRRRIGPTGWTPHWLRHTHATALLISGPRNGSFHAVLATPTCKPRSTSTAGSARTKRFALRRTGRATPTAGRPPSMHPDPIPLQPASSADHGPARLLSDLPAEWRGDVIGPGIEMWERATEGGSSTPLLLKGLPVRICTELAWMAHWQFRDGDKVTASEYNQLAQMLRQCIAGSKLRIDSLLDVDLKVFVPLYRGWFESRYGRLPSPDATADMRRAFYGYPRSALAARMNDGPWWILDAWIPRCDPRIPLRGREPRRWENCRPGQAQIPWMREAVKWHLGTALEAGTLTWSTVLQRCPGLLTFDRWLSTLDDPAALCRSLDNAGRLAASFHRWVSDPANRTRSATKRSAATHIVNATLRAVADLMAFIADNLDECRRLIGASPWDDLTDAFPLIWRKQITRTRSAPLLNDQHYVDDHVLSQIVASLPALGADPTETVMVRVGDTERELPGCGDPQTMRMLLLQILTGRRVSEICMCEFDCLSPPTARAVEAAEGEQVARFHYAQTKIDRAPDTILVDTEVVTVIEEQQQAVRDRFPGAVPRYLFPRRLGNQHGNKPVSRRVYARSLLRFSELIQVIDAKGRAIRLSQTHRFRHTRLTRLAELGLPVHVLQRYAGHANPTMSMHYVAQREEHAEQAFLATRKFKADGTAVVFSREDHDGMHLFDRADRFLPHGYCLLPPLQTCDKGNACLTCSVFVTDTSHLETLQRQLDETNALIDRTTEQFHQRHGKPMPDDNVWLIQRTAERNALVKLIATMRQHPARACQGAGSPTSGPVPITIDTSSHRKRVS